MAAVIMLVHDGFEEVEALTAVDILRRAGVKADICSMTGEKVLRGSHGVRIFADVLFDELGPAASLCERYDGIVLPGGLPNAFTLRDDGRVTETVGAFNDRGNILAAICAAPCVLERAGVLDGKRCTSYPDVLSSQSKIVLTDSVVSDGNVITSRGVGTAIDFALEIVSKLCGKEKAVMTARQIVYVP